jgi:hypothetical protein
MIFAVIPRFICAKHKNYKNDKSMTNPIFGDLAEWKKNLPREYLPRQAPGQKSRGAASILWQYFHFPKRPTCSKNPPDPFFLEEAIACLPLRITRPRPAG